MNEILVMSTLPITPKTSSDNKKYIKINLKQLRKNYG